MEEIEKNIRINELFDLYGNLLTENQQEMIKLYYQMDLSLGEIADQIGISRNAVYDSLKKSEKLLESYESKLSLLKKRIDLADYFSALKEKEENVSLVEEIERKVNS